MRPTGKPAIFLHLPKSELLCSSSVARSRSQCEAKAPAEGSLKSTRLQLCASHFRKSRAVLREHSMLDILMWLRKVPCRQGFASMKSLQITLHCGMCCWQNTPSYRFRSSQPRIVACRRLLEQCVLNWDCKMDQGLMCQQRRGGSGLWQASVQAAHCVVQQLRGLAEFS